MEEIVKVLVLQLQGIVRKQTKARYPGVNNAVKTLQDYVQETTATRSGVEDKLKELEDILYKKNENKKSCTDHIGKIRQAMRLQKMAPTGATKSKEDKRKPSSPATSEGATPMPSETKENIKLRSELTQPEETTKLSGKIDQNEEEYRDEMADEVRYFVECINGLKEVCSGDIKIPLEKKIPVPNGKIKKKVEAGHTSVMDVARDISRLKTENQYLRKTLDGLHKYIIGGDETALTELKPPKNMKDNQSIVEVEANVKEVTKKFHEIKTNAENVIKERECLSSTLQCLINHVQGLSTEGDISSALDQIKSYVKKESQANQFLTQAKDVIGIQMEWKREADYATHLFKVLKERLAYDGKQDTPTGLKEPPIRMERASSTDGRKVHKQQSDEKPSSRHIEQLQSNFEIVSNVLKKLMNAEESISERECLLSTLECLRNYVRDLFEGKTEAETSPSWDEIWSSIKKESSVSQGLSHAKEIAGYQMEWKWDAENAVKERACLLLALGCLFKHSRDLSEGTTEGDISSTLDQIKSSINKESLANQGLSHAGTILNIHVEWKREVEYVACLLEELANVSQSTNNGDNSIILSHPENFRSLRDYKTKDGKKTESSRNKPMKSVQNEKLMTHYGNASYILKQMKEKEVLRIDLGKRTDEVEDLMARLKKLEDENIEIKKDADSLRTRLSEHAGASLTHNNPSISDLSDPNRPTKLSEMYSELYDNQWTDAFANIEKKDPDMSDNIIVGYLYEMLVDGYHFCEDVRRKQILALEGILFDPAGDTKTSQRRQKEEISTIFAKHLSDVAKLSGNKSSAHVAKAFVMDEKIKDKYSKMIKLCERYIQECVQLCWLMQVQTPPLCLDLKTSQGQTFDKNCYREYTKKGKKIAFVVWPALFLHENGPVLTKGVAQCQ